MFLAGTAASPTAPEKTLAEIMKRDLNVEVNPEALRLFLLARWDRVSLLAHIIHTKG